MLNFSFSIQNRKPNLKKECNCCRDTTMKLKHIKLDNCVDADGNFLEGDSMTIAINEPHQCACFKCSN